MKAANQLSQRVGVSAACQALGVPRSTFYRARQPKRDPKPRPTPERALKPEEKEQVLQVLNSEPFQDCAPREVYATLLDDGQYLCSWSTMYRILKERRQVRERRNQLRHPAYTKPELLTTGPNQLWSWDLTKLRGPVRDIIKSCGLAKSRKVAYPCWGHHTPTTAQSRRKDTPWTRVPQMDLQDKFLKSRSHWTNWPERALDE